MGESRKAQLPYTVPRRFGIGTMLVVTAFFGAVFASVTWSDAPLEDLIYGGVILVVLVSQMCWTKFPRLASIISGACILPLVALVDYHLIRPGIGMLVRHPFLKLVAQDQLYWLVIVGAFIGYLSGTLLAGAYLIRDKIARLVSWLLS